MQEPPAAPVISWPSKQLWLKGQSKMVFPTVTIVIGLDRQNVANWFGRQNLTSCFIAYNREGPLLDLWNFAIPEFHQMPQSILIMSALLKNL